MTRQVSSTDRASSASTEAFEARAMAEVFGSEDDRGKGLAPETAEPEQARRVHRRFLLRAAAAAGVGTIVFQRALVALAQDEGGISVDMVRQAEWISGLELSDEEREEAVSSLSRAQRNWQRLREIPLENAVPISVEFDPAPWDRDDGEPPARNAEPIKSAVARRPGNDEALAFLPVHELAGLIRSRQVSSTELTRLYLARLKKFDPVLKCVVSLTEELALQQAAAADREIASGRYRGPLHGIPWGAKDLIAVPGYPTTWGAAPFREQMIDTKATVVRRLEQAGAVLVAKLSLGALAQGDQWFGGRTNNPWNIEQGSSGSSAGSASATAAGLVGFTLGSETLGSIVSPCRRCSVTGLRPTFGRVSRHGCMTLSWTMDKIGPITRSVEDCALILSAIHGFDGRDGTAVDRPFAWPPTRPLHTYRVGYFEPREGESEPEELEQLRQLGVQLVPIKLPDTVPASPLTLILSVEAATVFDEVTRQGITEGLNNWPRTFRMGQFVPAVEYLRAHRIRTKLMQEMREMMSQVDLYFGGRDLIITNLTGHPTVVAPSRMRDDNGVRQPSTVTFTGRLFGEADLLHVAHAWQQATGYHLEHPAMDRLLAEPAEEEDDN